MQLFSLSHNRECLIVGVRGKLSRTDYLAPRLPGYQSKNYFANSTYYKQSEYVDVSITNIIQVKFSCFLCCIVSNAKLRGGALAVLEVYLAPTHLGITVE